MAVLLTQWILRYGKSSARWNFRGDKYSLARLALRLLARELRRRGRNVKNLVNVATPEHGDRLTRKIEKRAHYDRWGFTDGSRGLLLYILVGLVILQTSSQGCMAVFKAREQMHHIAVQQCLNSAVVAAWIGASLAFHASLPLVVVGLVVGQVAETCLGWQIIGVNFPAGRPFQWSSEIITAMAVASAPVGITAILQAFNLRIDILVLGCYVSDRVLGQFQAAAWFPVAPYLGASLLITVLFPKLSRSLRHTSAQGRAYVVSLLKNGVLLAGLEGC